MPDNQRVSEIITGIRGVLASITLAWFGTTLAIFWFALTDNRFMILIWLAIQIGVLFTLASFGWSHLVQLWTGERTNDPMPRGFAILTTAFIIGMIAIWFTFAFTSMKH